MPGKKYASQREAMRQLLLKHGYDKEKVCAAYAMADQNGEIPRRSNMNDMSPEAYADEMWRDGHKKSGPWIIAFCRRENIKV
ncbi:MAG: hypothetical protein ABSA58_25695 [Acetobacteraceae bacterium]|jgi:hypothetical protein